MITTKEAFIDAKEVSQILGVGMTKAYAVIKAYNAELDARGFYTMRGKCPRKYFEQKIYLRDAGPGACPSRRPGT